MSNSYMNVVGPPPDPRSQSWRSWMRRLIQKWWAYCDKPRAVTYYFADDGDDTTTGLAYTSVSDTEHTFDTRGNREFLVGIQTAFAATGTVTDSVIQYKVM